LKGLRTAPPAPRMRAPAASESAPPTALPSPARSPGARVPAPRPRGLSATQAVPLGKAAPDTPTTPVPRVKLGPRVLRPAAVVGLGWLGGRVLRRLANAISERFGGLDQVPNLRLLALDTDPDAIQELTRSASAPFDPKSAVCLRLDRPSQYGRRDWGPQL